MVFGVFLFHSTALTQQADSIALSGFVIDSISKEKIPYVKLTVNGLGNSRTFFCDKMGFFKLRIAKGNEIRFNFLGYKPKTISNVISNSNLDVLLVPEIKELNTVNIRGRKSLVRQEIDKLVYDAKSDPKNEGLNALEMMNRVPLINTAGGTRVEINGKSGIKLLVNGRENILANSDPAAFLRALNASDIKEVEVITSPGAKYDAEGVGGVLNIVINKMTQTGYKGTVNSRFFLPLVAGTNTNVNIKTGKLGITVFLSDTYQKSPRLANTTLRSSLVNSDQVYQSGVDRRKSNSFYTGAELSYELDSINLLNFSISYNNYRRSSNNFQSSAINDSGLIQGYDLMDDGNYKRQGTNASITYQNEGKRNKKNLLVGSYQFNVSPANQYNELIASRQNNISISNLVQDNSTKVIEHSFQLDYNFQLNKAFLVEAGSKIVLRDNNSNATYGVWNNQNTNEPELSGNSFKNVQNVSAAYLSSTYSHKNIGVKAGIRFENTYINSKTNAISGLSSGFNRNYHNFVPSVLLQLKTNKTNSINLGYSTRIERPSIYQLNPFIDQTNPQYVWVGNANLLPTAYHNFELSFSSFKDLSARIGYNVSFANNTIQNTISQTSQGIVESSYENIGRTVEQGANLSMGYSFFKNLDLSLNSRLHYVTVSGVVDGTPLKNEGFQFASFLDGSYKLKTWRLNLYLQFNSPRKFLQREQAKWFYENSIGISKSFLQRKINASFSIANLYPKNRYFNTNITGNGFVQKDYSTQLNRQFCFTVSYRFGKLKEQIKKSDIQINNNDLKGEQ
ncbi:outer membrane beta-barrel family protein [Pedobacter sp. KR3-3]|uniref:Outer membrane beta-barrel family protein n=1 Tax=Pedobacter albus TaxID=3113905 RepID=A0ABU7I980_9SPHI|nr:outer membrane beta-barrel family protein [Pedobacter sp. KR3-3]MEE1946000.1 outer membrane beta-barrel family protein [Pedobacter sp. KR3-3]